MRPMEEHGHHVAGDELASASSSKLVRVRDCEMIVSGGTIEVRPIVESS
jgi:hypothetical protein